MFNFGNIPKYRISLQNKNSLKTLTHKGSLRIQVYGKAFVFKLIMISKKTLGYSILILLFLLSYYTRAQETFGFMDHNIYQDSRGFSTYTINTFWSKNKVEWFSLTNFNSTNKAPELNNFYGEFHLRYAIDKNNNFQVSQQFQTSTAGTDRLMYGIKINLDNWFNPFKGNAKYLFKVFTNLHLIDFPVQQSVQGMPQIEYVYLISRKLGSKENFSVYINGFADHNLDKGGVHWVTEHQIGLGFKNFYAVYEYRYNQYLTNASGSGFGLEYQMNF